MSDPQSTDETVERMAEIMRDFTASQGNCTKEDLIAQGFHPHEVEKHHEAAAALAAKRWRNAERAPVCNAALTALKLEVRHMEALAEQMKAAAARLGAGLTPQRICPHAGALTGGAA